MNNTQKIIQKYAHLKCNIVINKKLMKHNIAMKKIAKMQNAKITYYIANNVCIFCVTN